MSTTFSRVKRRREATATFASDLRGPWQVLAGRTLRGYEIRHGASRPLPPGGCVEALPDGLGYASGRVLGVYIHGMFEDPDVLAALFGDRPSRTLDATFDHLADAVDAHLDTDRLLDMTGPR